MKLYVYSRKVYLLILFSTFLQYSNYAQVKALNTIRINPDVAISGKVSQFIDEVSYIPLENTKKSEISDILQLEMSRDYYIILDKEKPYIYIFLKNGKYYNRISTEKIIYQFFFNKKDNAIEFENYPYRYSYTLEGKLVKKTIVRKIPRSIFGVSKMNLNKNSVAYFNTSIKSGIDSIIYELLIYKGDSITNHFFPYPKNYKMEPIDNLGFKNFIFEDEANIHTIYYIHNFDYCVYELNSKTLTPVYKFIFPIQYSLPDSFSIIHRNESKIQFLSQNKEIIVRLFGFFKSGNLIYFHTGQDPFIYDLITQHLLNLNKIVSDSLSYNLPISPSETKEGTLGFLNYDGKYFYSSISPQILFNKKNNTKEHRRYPDDINNFFKDKKNTFGNPVLIQIKFKQKL